MCKLYLFVLFVNTFKFNLSFEKNTCILVTHVFCYILLKLFTLKFNTSACSSMNVNTCTYKDVYLQVSISFG